MEKMARGTVISVSEMSIALPTQQLGSVGGQGILEFFVTRKLLRHGR